MSVAASPAPRAGHAARPFGRAPEHLALLAPALLARGDSCTCDPHLYHPVCPKGCADCVQRLVALPCGRSCPDNYCASVSSSSARGATVGGAVGGVLGGLILIVSVLLMYRVVTRRRKLAADQARTEARLRVAAADKFRPGGVHDTALAIPDDPSPMAEEQRTSVGAAGAAGAAGILSPRTPVSAGLPTAGSGAALVPPELEADTEYTELRPDGLTAFLHEDEAHEPGDRLAAPNPLNKRISTSAATHLSRISERTELDEDMHSVRSRATTHRAPGWARRPPLPGPAPRNLIPSPLSLSPPQQGQDADPFSDSHSVRAEGAAAAAQKPAPVLLGVPGQDPHRLSTMTTGTTGSAVSAASGVPARVMRVQLQKPGKVELVRHGSGRKAAAMLRSSSPTLTANGSDHTQWETASEHEREPEPEPEPEPAHDEQEEQPVLSSPFNDPSGVIQVSVPTLHSTPLGDPRATIMSGSTSSSSFAIPLIDASRGAQRAPHDGPSSSAGPA